MGVSERRDAGEGKFRADPTPADLGWPWDWADRVFGPNVVHYCSAVYKRPQELQFGDQKLAACDKACDKIHGIREPKMEIPVKLLDNGSTSAYKTQQGNSMQHYARRLGVLTPILIALFGACLAFGQGFGTIVGTTTDPTGAVVPAANIKITDE